MKVRNVSEQDIMTVVEDLNRTKYDGNLVLENVSFLSKNVRSFKLGTRDSRAIGSKVSASGRHGRWACTHVFEDVMRGLVERGGAFTGLKATVGTVSDLDSLRMHVEMFNNSNAGSIAAPVLPVQMCVEC